jgi:transposase InsO family protein
MEVMPWAERSIVSIRREFVLKALSKEAPITELCRQYGVSRKTGYKWVQRFRQLGVDGLEDQSRRPHTSPLATTAEVTIEIIKVRQEHPTWGARKLRLLLERRLGVEAAPSEATISRVLERVGMVRKRRQRHAPGGVPQFKPAVVVEAPNDLWTADFKGWWVAKDGTRCEPLTVRDAHSRYLLALQITETTAYEQIRAFFEELFARNGLPKAIQTDNGPPFASTRAIAGLTKLSAWWISLGIVVVRSRPGCPQDNGGHERMHADIKLELQADAADSREAQQLACDEWRHVFNHVRPHEALGMKTPAEVYRPSPRRMKHVLFLGSAMDGRKTYWVDSRGRINPIDGQRVQLTTALSGMPVQCEWQPDDRVFVWFYRMLLGYYTATTAKYRGGQPVEVPLEPVTDEEVPPAPGAEQEVTAEVTPSRRAGADASAGAVTQPTVPAPTAEADPLIDSVTGPVTPSVTPDDTTSSPQPVTFEGIGG